MGNDQAIWALTEYCSQQVNTESEKQIFNDMLLQALYSSQVRVDNNQTPLVPKDDLHRILQKMEIAPLSSENYYALGLWYLQGVPDYIERDELKAIRYFSEATNGVAAICQALQEGQINNPRACFDAAVLLHQASSASYQKERTLLFGKALMYADLPLKKQIINYCIEHEELVHQAVLAFNSYAREISKSADLVAAENDYQQSFTTTLMQWATGTKHSKVADINKRHPAAVMYFYDLYKKYPDTLVPLLGNTIKELADWVAFKGYVPALEALEPEFETIPKEIPALSRTVAFWDSWLKVYGNDEAQTQKVDLIADKIDWISILCLIKRPDGAYVMSNPETHYRLANVLMNHEPARALKHIFIAEQLIKATMPTQEGYDLINRTGTYEQIVQAAQRGNVCAKYAWAGIKADRIELFVERNSNNPSACFAEVEAARKLLVEAGTVGTDGEEFVLSQGQMDYMESYVADEIHKRHRDERYKARRLRSLDRAMVQGYPDAFYTWADSALVGEIGIGQEVLEKAIDFLCIAIEKGNKEAGIVLRDIDKNGFDYLMQCGGLITRKLREKTIKAMKQVKLHVHATDEPKRDSVAYGVYLLNRLEDLETAYTIFKNAAESYEPAALTYLGIMHREGIGVEQSHERAQEYFMHALRASRSLKITETQKRALNIANEALRTTSENNLEISAQRCRYTLDNLSDKDYDLNFALVMTEIEEIEKVLIKSPSNDTRNLLFSSGLMKSLVTICANTQSIFPSIRIAKMCAQRCLAVSPSTLATSADLALLAMPFAYLRDRLGQAILGMEDLSKIFGCREPHQVPQEISQEVLEVLSLLEKMVARGYLEPFEQVLGTFKLAYGLVTKKRGFANQGIAHWEHAGKNGDLQAAYMWALIKLRGEQIAPTELVKLPNGELEKRVIRDFLTNAPNVGLAKLKALVAAGHIPSLNILGQWYLEHGDAVCALEWYKRLIIAQPDSVTGAMGFLESISREYAKATDKDRALIAPALECAKKNKKFAARAGIIASYLRLVKKHDDITDEQALDYIGEISKDTSSEDSMYQFLKETQFVKKFSAWLASFEDKKNLTNNDFMAKAYLAYALLLCINAPNTDNTDNAYHKIVEECDKVLKLKPYSLEAESLKALASYSLNDQKAMKLSIMKCCKTLQSQNLKLDSVPMLNTVLGYIQMQANSKGRLNILTGDSIKEMVNDVAWAAAIMRKFAVPAKVV